MRIRSSAPGRICLFGEHQDYMGFPVIAAAINLRVSIEGSIGKGQSIEIDLPDLNDKIKFTSKNFTYTRKRDYFKSTVRVLKAKHLFKETKIDARVWGNIPIQAGTSSSSALVVAWTGFLLQASSVVNRPVIDPEDIAELAYLAEVKEFGESGGRMDQYTSAIGGIVHLDFHQGIKATPLPILLKEFVLGDSLQPKDTLKTLKRIRTGQESGLKELQKHFKFTDFIQVNFEEAEAFFSRISTQNRPYLQAVLKNRQITSAAKMAFLKTPFDQSTITELMNHHHEILRNELKISTPKIEKMIDQSLKAGALAAKINGSGEGGCMFAFCPGKQEEVASAICRAGGKPYLINIGTGMEIQILK